MGLLTGAQVLARVRQRAGIVNSQVCTDAEIFGYINDAIAALLDEVIGVYEHHFVVPFDFAVTTGNTATLPNDFYKDNGLDLNPGPGAVTIHRIASFLERNAGRRGYMIQGQTSLVIYPPNNAAGSYRLYYTPTLRVFDTDFTVRLATTSPLSPTGIPAGSGVGKTLTGSGNGALVVDGVAVAAGDRLLVKDQATGADNGIYVVVNTGSLISAYGLVRATDYDQALATEVRQGASIMVTEGAANANQVFVETAALPIAVDVNAQAYALVTMPQVIGQWTEYVLLASEIAVFDKRQMDPGDRLARFAKQEVRVRKMAANRTEEPGQIPLTRGMSTGGFWEDPPP